MGPLERKVSQTKQEEDKREKVETRVQTTKEDEVKKITVNIRLLVMTRGGSMEGLTDSWNG